MVGIMKITKRQLRRIIKEEKTKLMNEMASDDSYGDEYMEAMMNLYMDLEAAFTKAKRAGIDYTDLDTALDDAKQSTGY